MKKKQQQAEHQPKLIIYIRLSAAAELNLNNDDSKPKKKYRYSPSQLCVVCNSLLFEKKIFKVYSSKNPCSNEFLVLYIGLSFKVVKRVNLDLYVQTKTPEKTKSIRLL